MILCVIVLALVTVVVNISSSEESSHRESVRVRLLAEKRGAMKRKRKRTDDRMF